MKCHYHPDLDSSHNCCVCGRALCPGCAHSIKGRIFCQDCLVAGSELAQLARAPRLANYSPARAAFFAFIPGMGAVYNRQYTKAVAHFSIFAGLVMMGDSVSDTFVLFTISFYVFMIIDAYRSAQAIRRTLVAHPDCAQEEEGEEINLPLWGALLVAMGLVFFLDNMGILSLRQVIRASWPLLFVGVGLYLIVHYYRGEAETPPPGLPPRESSGENHSGGPTGEDL